MFGGGKGKMNSPGNPDEEDPCPKIIRTKEGKRMRKVWKVLGMVAVVITLTLSMSPGQVGKLRRRFLNSRSPSIRFPTTAI